MKKKVYLTVSIIFILAASCFAIYAAGYQLKKLRAEKHYMALRDEMAAEEEGSLKKKEQWNGIEIPDREIDWAELKLMNPDIYGYIYIPGTRVDYPLLQSEEQGFYLSHGADGGESENGAIYIKGPGKGFLDPNTVIFGSTPGDGALFSTLNYLEDADFFDRSPYIFIYTPAKTWIFEIFSAYRYGETPLESDFGSQDDFEAYLESIFAQKDMNANYRRNTKARLDGSSRIISCAALDGGEDDVTYVVCAVLLNTEP